MISYGQSAMDTQGPLVIDDLLQLTGIPLSHQIGRPADENAPDFTSGVDQPAVLGTVFMRRDASQVHSRGRRQIRGEYAFRLAGRVDQDPQQQDRQPRGIGVIGQQMTVGNLPEISD